MIQLVPNSGIFNDDKLDRQRGDAIVASQDGLPEPVVYYLRDLESRLLDAMARQKKQSLRDIPWKFKPGGEEA